MTPSSSLPVKFNYDVAFSRNLGWVTQDEQGTLRKARVAIGDLWRRLNRMSNSPTPTLARRPV